MDAMRRQARATRALRGGAAACVATFVALLTHVSAGGAMPGPLGIIVPLALSFAACTAVSGRRLSLVRTAVAVALSQVLFHTLFVLGGYDLAAAGHQHHGASPALADAGTTVVVSADAPMWLGHAVAVALTTLALHRGERTLSRLRLLAQRSVAWLRARVRLALGTLAPVPVRRVFADVVAAVRPTSTLVLLAARRRGPPFVAA